MDFQTFQTISKPGFPNAKDTGVRCGGGAAKACREVGPTQIEALVFGWVRVKSPFHTHSIHVWYIYLLP